MNRTQRAALTGVIAFLGAIGLFALTVYPFQYGLVESALLAAGFVVFAVVELVLDESSF